MSIKLHTTEKEPEDITPFAMIPQSVWQAYEMGKLNGGKVLLYAILHCHVNPFRGIGVTSYEKICGWLQLKPTKQNINHFNKIMVELRDKHGLIWYPTHSGSRGFEYVIAKYKLGKLSENKDKQPDRWIDIDPYFSRLEKDIGRGNEAATPKPPTEPSPRQQPQEQRSEGRNSGEMTHIGKNLGRYQSRPPYTDTDTQT
ncbi:MAG: hypothetical protein AABX72_02755 [Nanoarchaeota archaeon]